MFDSIRARLIVIGILVALSVLSLWPRDITIRLRGADGRMRDTTERRVPWTACSPWPPAPREGSPIAVTSPRYQGAFPQTPLASRARRR